MFQSSTNFDRFSFSSRGYPGACSVCTLPVEQSSYRGSSRHSAGLVEESFHPQDLHFSGSTRLPSGHVGGLQRSVTQETVWYVSTVQILKLNSIFNPVLSPYPWFSGDTLAQASVLMPLLLQTVEKAVAQNSQQALLAEGVAASVLLSRLALLETQTGEAGISTVNLFPLKETVKQILVYKDWRIFCLFVPAEAKFSSFWNLILDEKKPLFTTEKFLFQANEESKATSFTSLKAHECSEILIYEMMACVCPFHSVFSSAHSAAALWKALPGPCSQA